MAGKQADIKVGVVTNYDDKGVKQAQTGLAGFSKSIADADGVGGKFKAGWGSVTDTVKANAGAMAVGAGASLVAFGVKAVGAFTDTAKAALDLSTSTGLAVEDASRWIGVGDDFQVGAEALATGLGKITKTMDSAKWEEYGIATHDAGGRARDVNDILLDTFDVLSKVDNKTDQARIGQQLFGKGYQSLTPILGHTRAEYEAMLGSVEKGQVITAEEAEKAEKMRLAEDELGDAIHEVTLQIGQQLSGLVPLVNMVIKFIGVVGDAFGPGGLGGNKFREATDGLREMRGEIEAAGLNFGKLDEQVLSGEKSLEDIRDMIKEAGVAAGDSTTSTEGYSYAVQDLARSTKEAEQATRDSTNSVEGYSYAVQDVQRSTEEATAAVDRNKKHNEDLVRSVTHGLDEIQGKWDELTGNIDANESWANLQLDFMDLKTKGEEALTALSDGTEDARQKSLDYQVSVDGQKKSVIDYVKEVLKLPPERAVKILTAIDAGDLERAEALLANLTRNRNINIDLIGKGAAGYGVGARAGGGPVEAGQLYVVGENGEELFVPEQDGQIINARQTGQIRRGSKKAHALPVVVPQPGDQRYVPPPSGEQMPGGYPELLPGPQPGDQAYVAPASARGGASDFDSGYSSGGGGDTYTITGPITIYMQPGSTPDDMMQSLAQYVKRNGPGSMQKLVGI